MKRLIALLTLLALLLAGCAGQVPETSPVVTVVPTEPTEITVPPTTRAPDPLDLLLESMTLREKVGQLFIVRPEALTGGDREKREVTDALRTALETCPVGGFILFADNITGPEQLRAFNEALTEACAVAPFLSIDEECGRVARLANHGAFDLPKYQSAGAVGDSGDSRDALKMGDAIGQYLAEYGFNVDFAPVADVNSNPYNPVIGTRAFSSDPEVAAAMADAMAMGLRQNGITAVFKHFPGHGDTAEDSHAGLAVTYKTREEMAACEWLPFREADAMDWVMIAHVAAPEVTGDLTPATMSREMVTEILRGELGFDGLVITDAMEMGAITERYSSGEAALAALNAGCDLILIPQDLQEAFEEVLSAVQTGAFPEEKLDGIVRRILKFKMDAGMLGV